jgi:hypothetical protein
MPLLKHLLDAFQNGFLGSSRKSLIGQTTAVEIDRKNKT